MYYPTNKTLETIQPIITKLITVQDKLKEIEDFLNGSQEFLKVTTATQCTLKLEIDKFSWEEDTRFIKSLKILKTDLGVERHLLLKELEDLGLSIAPVGSKLVTGVDQVIEQASKAAKESRVDDEQALADLELAKELAKDIEARLKELSKKV